MGLILMKKSHIFWFVVVLIANIRQVIQIVTDNYSPDIIHILFTILGPFVLIHEAKILLDDIKQSRQNKENE